MNTDADKDDKTMIRCCWWWCYLWMSVCVKNVVVVDMTSPSGSAYIRGQRCPEEMRNSTRFWIRRDPSLPRDSWQPFIDWGTTQGRLSLHTADILSTIVKRSMLTDVDKLPSCSRFSDSVVGFTGQKIPPAASKYWRSNRTYVKVTDILVVELTVNSEWVSECKERMWK